MTALLTVIDGMTAEAEAKRVGDLRDSEQHTFDIPSIATHKASLFRTNRVQYPRFVSSIPEK